MRGACWHKISLGTKYFSSRHPLSVVYGPNIFKNGRTNIHEKEKSGRPTVVSDDLVSKIGEKVHENWRFTISEFSEQFLQISRMVLQKFVTDKLGYCKFCAWWVSKMLRDLSNQTNGLCFRLSFTLWHRRRKFLEENCDWRWNLDGLHEHQNKITVDGLGPHEFSMKIKESSPDFSVRKVMAKVF